jgi:N-acetylmuramoyl-L-alanine amidase
MNLLGDKIKVFFIFTLVLAFFFPVGILHAAQPIRILIVPGHDNVVWGAQYKNIKEADMNLVLATKIYNLLKKDKRFQVYITRNSAGYTKTFADYFSLHRDDIIAFKENAKKGREDSIASGQFVVKEGVPHHSVSEDVSVILYGINKWVDENKIDAVLHVHFNDYVRTNKNVMGIYKGFAVYMPEAQMANSQESSKLAQNIFTELKKKYTTSTYEKEKGGLIPDQNLIALGANGTLLDSVRSVLVEYGYIYRFGNSVMRHQAYTTMANLTVAGIEKTFSK